MRSSIIAICVQVDGMLRMIEHNVVHKFFSNSLALMVCPNGNSMHIAALNSLLLNSVISEVTKSVDSVTKNSTSAHSLCNHHSVLLLFPECVDHCAAGAVISSGLECFFVDQDQLLQDSLFILLALLDELNLIVLGSLSFFADLRLSRVLIHFR